MTSRGAAALDAYDTNYKQLDLQYDYVKSDAELSLKAQIFRKALFVIQIIMVVGAGLVIMGAEIALRTGVLYDNLPFGTMEAELVYVPFACGGVSAITAFIGCVGARSQNRRKCYLVIYLGLIGLSLILAIAGCAQAYADFGNEYNYALRQWRALTNAQIILFQTAHSCCNFDTLTPCCRFAPGQGDCTNTEVCYDQVLPHLESNFELIAITNLLHSIYLFIIALLSFLLCKLIERNPNLSFGGIFNFGKNRGPDSDMDGVTFDKDDDDYFN